MRWGGSVPRMNTDEKQGQASGIAAVVAAVALTVVLIAVVLVARAEAKPRAWHTSVASIFSVSEQGEMACRSYGGLVVAHKSLPCGTRIKFCKARCAWARVGDRGPYSGNREFDLDTGLARAIGFSFRAGVGTVHWRLGGR